MRFIFIALTGLSLIACKNITKEANKPGQEKYENVSCKDYSKPFKSALINSIKNQPDNFFKQANNTSFQFFYSKDGSCVKVFEKYSTVLANEQDNWSIGVKMKEYFADENCTESLPSNSYSSELMKYNNKETLLTEIANQNIQMGIDTDRPCHVSIDSTKDYLKLSLFVDGQEVKNFNWDFKDMKHPGEIPLRLENINYKRKLSPIVLENKELQTIVHDCINRDRNDVCVSTSRSLKDWLDSN